MNERKILKTNEDESKLLQLLLLKTAAEWLDHQSWTYSPYGGENEMQYILFRTRIMSQKEWEDLFRNDGKSLHPERVQEMFDTLKSVDPQIKQFCEQVLR